MKVLIFNAGSSSLKFSLLQAEREATLAEGTMDAVTSHADAVAHVIEELQSEPSAPVRTSSDIGAVGHRVVHGGDLYVAGVRVTSKVLGDIEALSELAPLHNKLAATVIKAAQAALPRVPQFAAFDTAFHATLSQAARTYALPATWSTDWRLRRYGFHGLSHSYCAARASEMLGRRSLRLVIAHLGNGASASAVRDAVCVDTTMGFTPMDGLVMGTRSGAVDPGILVYLLRHKGLNADQIDYALNHESGLLGVSGVASDMRAVLAAAGGGDAQASLAIDVYVHRLRQTIGAMAATLGGVDALVFTAGVGEHSAEIRRRTCNQLEFLGLELDAAANTRCTPDMDIALPTSIARILVIGTREDLAILREIKRLTKSNLKEGELL